MIRGLDGDFIIMDECDCLGWDDEDLFPDDELHSEDFLKAAIGHQKERAAMYASGHGERSMDTMVSMFNILYGQNLTEEQGWAFLCLLKLVRTTKGAFKEDNYEDLASYAALMGESAQHRGKVCDANIGTVGGATPPKERKPTQDLEDVMIHPDALVGMEKMMMAYAEAFPMPLAKSSGPTSTSLQ